MHLPIGGRLVVDDAPPGVRQGVLVLAQIYGHDDDCGSLGAPCIAAAAVHTYTSLAGIT